MKPLFSALLLPFLLIPVSAQNKGIAPAWDVQATMTQLTTQVKRYKSIIDQLNVQDWVRNGASDAYLRQQKVVQAETGNLGAVSSQLANQPEKLSLALDAYIRLETLESLTASLSEGASRYQNQQIGDQLSTLMNENATTRNKLRQYLMDLSVAKEQAYDVAEKEAQRCQQIVNRNPLAPPPVVNKPAKTSKEEKK